MFTLLRDILLSGVGADFINVTVGQEWILKYQ